MTDYRKVRAVLREFLKVYEVLEKPNKDYAREQFRIDRLKECDSLNHFFYWLRWLERTEDVRDDELEEDEKPLSIFAPFYQLVKKLSPEERMLAFKGVRRIVRI